MNGGMNSAPTLFDIATRRTTGWKYYEVCLSGRAKHWAYGRTETDALDRAATALSWRRFRSGNATVTMLMDFGQ